MTHKLQSVKSKEHPLKGTKQSPEHIAKRVASVRLAFQRPEVQAKLFGRPCSSETRAKIGAANAKHMKDKKLSPEHRANMVAGIKKTWEQRKTDPDFMAARKQKLSKALKGKYTGKKASNWRGGINQNERMGAKHESWKQAVLERDNYTCQVCKEIGVFLHIDHIKSWAKFPELRFELDNGRALCRPCHYYVTFKRKMPKGSKWAMSKRSLGILDLA